MKKPAKHSTDGKDRLGRILSELKNKEFRITPQRLEIVKILIEDQSHPDVAAIYKKVKAKFPTTSLATIYKTILLLKELNEVLELGFPEGSNRYDGYSPFPHPHMICTQCKKIVDPELKSLTDLNKEVSRKTGYQISHHRIDFFGLCPQCQKA